MRQTFLTEKSNQNADLSQNVWDLYSSESGIMQDEI